MRSGTQRTETRTCRSTVFLPFARHHHKTNHQTVHHCRHSFPIRKTPSTRTSMEYDSSSKDNDSSTKDNDSSSKGRYADCEWKSPVVESGLLHSPEIIRSVGTQRSGKNLLLPPVQNGPKRPTNTRVIQLLKRSRNVVNHSYVDYSLVPYRPADNVLPDSIDGMNFPQKLHLILDHSEARDLAVWLPHGRAFKIINPTKFEKIVCPKYFGHKRYSSFLNQVGVHGFKVITRARDRNCFYSQVNVWHGKGNQRPFIRMIRD